MGTLIDGMRDNSGQMYMRNRYYDPASGRFTQEDPIGLAGGLNAYGYANGDPVSYDDAFGLAPRDVYVSCRYLQDTNKGAHCAVRIVSDMRSSESILRTSYLPKEVMVVESTFQELAAVNITTVIVTIKVLMDRMSSVGVG
jgi:RHS repeat-associated protein